MEPSTADTLSFISNHSLLDSLESWHSKNMPTLAFTKSSLVISVGGEDNDGFVCGAKTAEYEKNSKAHD